MDAKQFLEGTDELDDDAFAAKMKRAKTANDVIRSENNKDLAHAAFRIILGFGVVLLLAAVVWVSYSHYKAGDVAWVETSAKALASHVAAAIAAVNGWPWLKGIMSSTADTTESG